VLNAINTLIAGPGRADGLKPGKDTNARLGEAARQFEALLLAQILKSARQSSSGGPEGGTDAAGGCAMEYAEEQVAELLAQRGGLGIANVLVTGLRKEQAAASAVPGRGTAQA
jgi:Rod binding domain-containing protein